jgi:hypothetical protein
VATVSAAAPRVEAALQESYRALLEIASYTLDPAIAELMRDLGERSALLDEAEHKQLLALVELTQRLTLEKLRAELALKRIEALCPELVPVQ